MSTTPFVRLVAAQSIVSMQAATARQIMLHNATDDRFGEAATQRWPA